MDRIGEILEATLVGLIAVPAFLFASRRRAPEAGGD
jgi:hypothetical protein